MPITEEQYNEDVAHITENMNNAQARAAEWRAKGNEERAKVWDASAARYAKLLELKARIYASSQKVQEIRDRISASPSIPDTETPPPGPKPGPPPLPPPPLPPPPPIPDDDMRNPWLTDTTVSSTPSTQEFKPPVQPTPAVPAITNPVIVTPPPPPVKTAPIDTVLYNEDAQPIEIMADLIFENIGGQELINIARTDTVNGQTVIYQPIKNLTQIQQQYNPNNIVGLQATSDKYFQNFTIKLDNKIPEEGTGPAGAHVYIDPETGDLVVEAINLENDEQIELEINTSGTIYEAEI